MPKEQENQEKSSKEPGFSAKMSNFMGKAASAIASAAAGAAAGAALGSIVPGLGTAIGGFAGAIVGALFGRAVLEPALNSIFGVDTTPVPAVAEKATAAPINQAGINTAQITAQLGGSQAQPSPTASLIEAPTLAPSTGKSFSNPLFVATPAPNTASSQMSNPAALPKPQPPGVASAA